MIKERKSHAVLDQHHHSETIPDRVRELDAAIRKESRMRLIGLSVLIIALTSAGLPLAFSAEPPAATPASAVYSLTLEKGAAGGGDLAVRVVTTLGAVTQGRAGDAAADVAGVTVDATGLRGDVKVGADLWTLDATVQGEKVTGKWRGTVGGKAANGTLTGTVQARDALPYCHADFYPSPARPVYFRMGNGEYPGATPPTEWWEGTPARVKMDGVFGNPPRRGPTDVWDTTDTTAKNVLWKVPVPGWGLSHPIVVGTRVFAVGEPDFVTCWDLATGKQLWQRRMMPLLLDGLPEERAAAGQKVLDLARALWVITGGGSTSGKQKGNLYHYGVGDGPAPDSGETHEDVVAKRKAFADKVLRMARKHRPDVEAFGDADLLKALDEDIAILQAFAQAKDQAALAALIKDRMARSNRLVSACASKLGVGIGGYWWGYVGSADSTLASDGQRVFGVFDQGQVFCLDLDGNLLWVRREKGTHDNRGAFHRSPSLCDGLLLVRSFTAKGNVRPLRAFDAATGELRWEVPLAGSNYTVPRLMRLKDPAGADVDVLIGDAPASREQGQQIVRVRDGKVIGHIPYQPCGRGALMGISGDVVTWGSTDDRGGGPSCAYRVKLADADTATAKPLFVAPIFRNQADFPTMRGTAWLYRNTLYDAVTGKGLATMRTERFGCAVVAGHYLIALADAVSGNDPLRGRVRADRKAMSRFVVVDISDPAATKVVSDRSLLGYPDPPADIIMRDYLSEFDPYDFARCYAGTASYFSLMGGPVPCGSRLLVQSTAYLYCIGPALQGAPGDAPATVQAIRAAKPAELATYLTSTSALYRHTAVTAMITAGIGQAKEALTRLVSEDPYEEIRAAAILALNAAEPDAAPGTQALLPLMTAAWAGGRHDDRLARQAMRRTLEALGAERGTALFAAAFTKTQDEPTRQSIIDFAAVMGWAAPELTRQAEAYLAFRGPNVLAVRYLAGLDLIKSDKEVREALKRAYPHLSLSEDAVRMLAAPLGQALEGEEKIAFLLHYIRGYSRDNHPGNRAPFLRQLQEMGRGAASAIPELEKMVAAREQLAAEFAPVIAAIKGK